MNHIPPKILIVDDDPQVHKMLTTVLLPKNYEVDSALDASRAWDKMQISAPDLIILDVMMPGMSGIELCKKLRKDDKLKGISVLMLSAKDTQDDRIHGLQYGADDYVTKPFHVASLVRKVEYMLSKRDEENSSS